MTLSNDEASAATSRNRRTLTIQWSLFRNLFLLVVVVAGGLFAKSILSSRATNEHLSNLIIARAADKTEAEMLRFFDPVARLMLMIRSHGKSGLFTDTEGVESFLQVLRPIISEFPQISSVNTGDPSGRGMMILRLEESWKTREVWRDEWGSRTVWKDWNEEGGLEKELVEDTGYDPRARPWYQELGPAPGVPVKGDAEFPISPHICWTKPYVFYTTREPGITASIWTTSPEGSHRALAVDILLRDLSRFTSDLQPSANGFAFIMSEDRLLLGLPNLEQFDTEKERIAAVLKHPSEVGVRPLIDAVVKWAQNDRPIDKPMRLSSAGQAYWVGFRDFRLGDKSLTIGVVIPEIDVLGRQRNEQTLLLASTALALLVAIAMTLFLSRAYRDPIKEIVDQTHELSRFYFDRPRKIKSSLAEITELAETQERLRSRLQTLARYAPLDLVRALSDNGVADMRFTRNAPVSILFSDVQGFTSIVESEEPEDVAELMSDYFEILNDILIAEGATIDNVMGDAVMAIWGAPTATADQALKAVEAAIKIQAALDEANGKWQEQGRAALNTRIGIACGEATVGVIGSFDRWKYTALGDTVNVASRLEKVNSIFQTRIVTSEGVHSTTKNLFVWRKLDRLFLRSKREPVVVYEVLGRCGQVGNDQLKLIYDYERAFEDYEERRFDGALQRLKAILSEFPDDQPSLRLEARCKNYARKPPPKDWDPAVSVEPD